MRRRTKIIIVVFAAIAIIGIGFTVWAETPLGPMKEALDALNSYKSVAVTDGSWLTFQPINGTKSVGFIIYPGGRIDYRSYAPEAHAIASMGYLVVIVRMPLNLAVFGVNSAQNVIDSYPEIRSWAVGGHSLGGTMAAQYVSNAPPSVKGLVLWTSYPASGNDLSGKEISVVTIHGSRDGLVSTSQIDDSMKMLPPDTIRAEIQGGNHAQFGWYGPQPGDNDATISRDDQQMRVVQATVQLLEKIG